MKILVTGANGQLGSELRFLSKNKINVVSHIGVTPQKFSDFTKIKSIY